MFKKFKFIIIYRITVDNITSIYIMTEIQLLPINVSVIISEYVERPEIIIELVKLYFPSLDDFKHLIKTDFGHLDTNLDVLIELYAYYYQYTIPLIDF